MGPPPEPSPPPPPRSVPGLSPPRFSSPELTAGPPPKSPDERRTWLRAKLDELFSAPWLAKSKVSVLVADSDTGKPLYARSEKTLLNAASNVKIVTSAAALALLGPEYRWKTAVYGVPDAAGSVLSSGGELSGDLYVRGFGDPMLSTQDMQGLAADLWASGLRRVRGGLVIDESFFGPPHVGPAFEQKPESAAFRAPSSATSLNGNVVAVTVIPAPIAGAPARVIVEPSSPYFIVAGRVVTSRTGPAATLVETSEDAPASGRAAAPPRTRVMLGGRVRLGTAPRTFLRRIVHPDVFFASTFKQILNRRGITVDKASRTGAIPPEGARILASHDSAALGVIAHDLNKRSNNFTAEQIIRTLGAEIVGRPGTWENGVEAVARYLDAVGVPRGSYHMSNGSGLYDSNRFSADQIVTVVRAAMRDFRISGEFVASLALAGADGTIGHRMGGSLAERYVRAKTGTLSGTSCLSGIAGSPGRAPLLFSILMNEITSPAEARHTQDRAAEILVSYLDGPTP